ncbi:AAA family ATPase [Enterococcus mundtii]|uniref:AAA family ATPase n=1 Tax=Enterococcus mundtii TaxID=53346 RepID=UPI001A9667A8|nr:AAA family ATPase [Enterococcus mundtii]MBO1087203.1 AAA family ATPase [Enterococcus mundtii]
MDEKIIDVIGKCTYIAFSKGDFMIAKFETPEGIISVKGNMFVAVGEEYQIKAEHDLSNPKYKNSYKSIQVKQNIDFDNADDKVVKAFLSSFLTEKQTKEIMMALPSPIDIIKSKDIESLISVKGVGIATAERIIRNYEAQKDYSEAFVAFADFDITDKLIKKICDHFGDVNTAIARVKDNPFSLTEVAGIGFKKADYIFLSNPENDPNDIRRIRAYTDHLFETHYQDGHTWMSPKEYVEKYNEQFYDGNFKQGVDYIIESSKYVVFDVEENGIKQKRLSLSRVVSMELECVELLQELLDAESKMKFQDIESIISDIEETQGWSYSKEQRQAIHGVFTTNVVMLQGLAGTGKSSVAKAFLGVLLQNGYSYLGCTLSGKAADNLSKTTGQKASTIHSMLQYEGTGFHYNEKNKLPTNAVLLDELSMPNLEIFLSMLKAVPLGAKLIMLGDFGQLEAIGVGVMGSFIRSRNIPMMLLRKIHRQAEKSAIITHSIEYRQGTLPKELDTKTIGESLIYGEMEDLEYIFLDDDSKIGINTLTRFKEMLKTFDLKDIQILCSTKKTGAVSCSYLNENAQRIANPSDVDKPEVSTGYKDNKYVLRLGDKVINMKNNRGTMSPDGKLRPIFNGNTGIITDVDVPENSVTINFDGIGEVVITSENLMDIELGYAITIHKAQGSTIDCVILALPWHFLLNSRELLYTGLTRARKYQIVVTTEKALKSAAKKSNATKKNVNLDIFIGNYEKWRGVLNNV